MSDVDIRAARPTDLARVLHLASAFCIEDGFATRVSELRDNLVVLLHTGTARVGVASRQHDIVGFAITTLGIGLEQGPVAELNDLFVEPAHRRTGVAAALIDDSADWVRSRGCCTLGLVIAPNRANVAHLFCYYAHQNFTDERLVECFARWRGYSFSATLRSIVQVAPRCRGAVSMRGHVAVVSARGRRLTASPLMGALPYGSNCAQAPARCADMTDRA